MGVHPNVSVAKFPKQGSFHNRRVKVCFNYDADNFIMGTIIRDDTEDPFVGIIKLDDGRHVLTTECQYSPV